MRILFLLENTAAAPEGGTEISASHLASLLRKKGVKVMEWAPYRRRRSPFWYTSLVALPFLVLKTLVTCRNERIGLIHIQGKYLVPAGVIAARLLKIPVVVTIRDYYIFCPIGLCLFHNTNRHNVLVFIKKEIPEFLNRYHPREYLVIRIARYPILVRSWLTALWIRWWTRKADAVIAVSTYVASILKKYDITSRVIRNCFDFSKYRDVVSQNAPRRVSRRRDIVFVGKDSYGKGSDLFGALSKVQRFSKYRFVRITTDRWTPYENVLATMRGALVTVVPSRWQEPFGRVALESIVVGTPVVATGRGGLPEIVKDSVSGFLTEPRVSSLKLSLIRAISINQLLRKRIQSRQAELSRNFQQIPLKRHLDLYNQLV